LINFKNYQQADIELSPSINCFIGPNGAGKTNILDAVHYLSMCKSYLNPVDSQNIQFDASFFVLQSEWGLNDERFTVYCGVKKGQKKILKKNKVTYEKLADHIGLFPTVMISPYDRNLILEGSEVRRKWMDGIIAQFDRDFLRDLIKYGKVLSQRNALLKNASSNGFFDPESIGVWDEQLVQYGTTIHKARANFIQDFIPIFQKYYQWLSNNREEVGLDYRSQLSKEDFSGLLKNVQRKDQMKQYTTVGTHKDDLVFTIKNHPIKKFGSQGQQKSFLIALRLAQYEWLLAHLKRKPVLLLDDIFDKLDQERVELLMQMVNDQDFGQVLITDTDHDRISTIFKNNDISYKSFSIYENTISELKNVPAT